MCMEYQELVTTSSLAALALPGGLEVFWLYPPTDSGLGWWDGVYRTIGSRASTVPVCYACHISPKDPTK